MEDPATASGSSEEGLGGRSLPTCTDGVPQRSDAPPVVDVHEAAEARFFARSRGKAPDVSHSAERMLAGHSLAYRQAVLSAHRVKPLSCDEMQAIVQQKAARAASMPSVSERQPP
eukprot:RCo015042